MASDRQAFKRAYEVWENHKEEGNFSVPIEFGTTAIVSSAFTDEEPDTITGITELQSFRTEAYDLAYRISQKGGRAEVAIDATHDDITNFIRDPNVVSMYVIGNGSLSSLILDVKVFFDWQDAAQATTHLKLGQFVQRQCGGLTRALNVPMGLFVMDDPRNVMAAVGVEFYPLTLEDKENEKIQPVFSLGEFNYQSIKNIAPQPTQEASSQEVRDAVARLDLVALEKIVAYQPRIEPGDDRIYESPLPSRPITFTDNFYKRFSEVQAVIEGRANDEQATYIRMIKERFGLDMVNFYRDNFELCEEICKKVADIEPYQQLVLAQEKIEYLIDRGELPDDYLTFLDRSVRHPLGLAAVGTYYMAGAEPLLRRAYDLLQPLTFNAAFLKC